MVFLKIILLSIFLFTFYRGKIVDSHKLSDEQDVCNKNILRDYDWPINKKYTHPFHIPKKCFLEKRLDLLTSEDSEKYYKYCKGQIILKDEVPCPSVFCAQQVQGLIEKQEERYDLCYQQLKEFFVMSNVALTVVNAAYSNLVKKELQHLKDTDAAVLYFNLLHKLIEFNKDIMTPAQYCKTIYKRNDAPKRKYKRKTQECKENPESSSTKRINNPTNESSSSVHAENF